MNTVKNFHRSSSVSVSSSTFKLVSAIMQEDNKKMKVKKGWLAVQVGLEDDQFEQEQDYGGGSNSQRFVIPISYLYHPLFKRLLDKAREVYGYHTDGPLKLPCSVDDFLHLRWRIEKESGQNHHHNHYNNHLNRLPHALHFNSC